MNAVDRMIMEGLLPCIACMGDGRGLHGMPCSTCGGKGHFGDGKAMAELMNRMDRLPTTPPPSEKGME